MKLSRINLYALQALAHLTTLEGDRPMPSHIIAEATGSPERFLVKALRPLVNARILHAVTGPHGGYTLARLPKEVTVLEVIEAVSGPIRGDLPTFGGSGLPTLESALQEANEVARRALGKVTVADLAGKPRKAGKGE